MRKLLLLLLPLAWMALVEAQTPTPTVDGFFNPVGEYEDGVFTSGLGWSSKVTGYHENPDGTIEVFTNFDTLAGQFIDYAFTLDGENWYPSSEELGTYGALDNIFSPNDRYTYGTYGVKNFQGTTVVPVTWSTFGSMFSMAYFDEPRNQVILLEQLNDDPENNWDEPVNNLILWDGTNYQVVGSGILSVTSMIPVDSGNSLLIVSHSFEGPCFYKLSLVEEMMVPLSPNEDLGHPDGATDWNSGLIFLGKPTVTGSMLGHGMAITQLDETGWENNVTELSTSGLMYLNEDESKLFYCAGENQTNEEGAPGQYMSGIAFTQDMETWTPVYDERLAKCTDGYDAIPLFSKGTMWVIAKQAGTMGIRNEEDANIGCDLYVLKSTYTPYTEIESFPTQGLVVYPNPATDYFVYDLPESGSLFSLEGKFVKTISAYEKSVSVTNIPSGMYVIKTEKGSSVKVVIQH